MNPGLAKTASTLADLLMRLAHERQPGDPMAETLTRAALEMEVDHRSAKQALGRLRAEQGEIHECKVLFQHAEAWLDLSVVLAGERKYAAAIEAARKAERSNPAGMHYQLMAIHWEMGQWDLMYAELQVVLALDPDHAMARVALGQYKLARKDFTGFQDVEFRPWARAQKAACDEFPEWDGRETLEGKALLVLWQDGLGDQVMYSRFLPYLKQLAKRVVLFTQPELARVFHDSFPQITVAGSDGEIGDVDCWIGMASLGKCDLPINPQPYLTVPEARKQRFKAYMQPGTNLRVGLCWAGNPEHTQDRNRSLPFEWFRPLLGVGGIDFYSLQFGPENARHAGELHELSRYCMDVADSAAAIANLDLVISIDTAAVHIAGAIGTEAWVLTRTPSDWRWELSGPRSYWYDTVRIFRDEWIHELYGQLDIKSAWKSKYAAPVEPVETARHGEPTYPVLSKYGGLTFFSKDQYCGRSIREYGEWSAGEMQLLAKIVTRESVVVEAGAFLGAHTVALASMAGKVFAFEPQPQAFKLLLRNVACYKNVRGYNFALGDSAGTAFCSPADTNFVHNGGKCPVEDSGMTEINVITLDSMAHPHGLWVDLIKADVEGSEARVLRGARDTIRRCRPILYLENDRLENEAELLSLIDELDYRIYSHQVPLFNPDNWSGNKLNVFGMLTSSMLLCVPKERYDLRAVTKSLPRVRV